MASKYKAIKTTLDGITFDSKREAQRYSQLKLMEKAGLISNLELQPKYDLLAFVPLPVPACAKIGFWKGDFRYQDETCATIIEDAKGVRTAVYRLKKRMVEATYGIKIKEV